MAKVNIKYEKFTHFCGIYFTNKAFKAFALGKIISIYYLKVSYPKVIICMNKNIFYNFESRTCLLSSGNLPTFIM